MFRTSSQAPPVPRAAPAFPGFALNCPFPFPCWGGGRAERPEKNTAGQVQLFPQPPGAVGQKGKWKTRCRPSPHPGRIKFTACQMFGAFPCPWAQLASHSLGAGGGGGADNPALPSLSQLREWVGGFLPAVFFFPLYLDLPEATVPRVDLLLGPGQLV